MLLVAVRKKEGEGEKVERDFSAFSADDRYGRKKDGMKEASKIFVFIFYTRQWKRVRS